MDGTRKEGVPTKREPNEAELRIGKRIAEAHGLDLETAIELLREVW